MSYHPSSNNSFATVVKKFFLSFFVVISFLAYVLHEHFTTPAQADVSTDSGAPTPSNGTETFSVRKENTAVPIRPTATDVPTAEENAIAPASDQPTDVPIVAVIDTPTPQPTSVGVYKDGTYTGPEADAYYGMVQVQAVIQNGKLTSVSFLEYPDHRRTSVRINSQAMPWLQQEAIQAQSAQVDLVSGATLTSEAFIQSLQAALDSARN